MRFCHEHDYMVLLRSCGESRMRLLVEILIETTILHNFLDL
jgi:hypothetical protein